MHGETHVKKALDVLGEQPHTPLDLPPQTIPGTYCTGVLVNRGDDLDGCGEKNLVSLPGFETRTL
jgi:hypothetical protein